ncbi:MAG: hypothetical protein N2560_01960 [Ignavibacteria bacterium]|nr:hypothetical protein [Ignavibacteria bacterium]
MNKISKIIIFLCLLFSPFEAFTQIEEQPSPLGPGRGRKQSEVGFFVGIGPNWQSGEFFASCNCPNFKDGNGLVLSTGIIYQRDFSSLLQWGVASGLSFQNATSSYKERELLTFESQSGDIFTNIPVLFRQKSIFDFSFIELMPYLVFSPFEFINFGLGLKGGIPFHTHIKHTKELLDNRIRLDNGETIELSISNPNIEEGKIERVNSIIFYLVPSIRVYFRLTGNIFTGLSFSYHLPLNNFSERGRNFRLNHWLVSLDIRYALQLRKWLN